MEEMLVRGIYRLTFVEPQFPIYAICEVEHILIKYVVDYTRVPPTRLSRVTRRFHQCYYFVEAASGFGRYLIRIQ